MSTVLEIEDAILQLPPQEVAQLREWLNRIEDAAPDTLAGQLGKAGWLVSPPESQSPISANEIPIPIKGVPLSETIIADRR